MLWNYLFLDWITCMLLFLRGRLPRYTRVSKWTFVLLSGYWHCYLSHVLKELSEYLCTKLHLRSGCHWLPSHVIRVSVLLNWSLNSLLIYIFLLHSSCSALIRPGRFDMQVTVPRPDVKGRTEILKWYLNKIKFDQCKYQNKHLSLL